jgi:hypothetical protein
MPIDTLAGAHRQSHQESRHAQKRPKVHAGFRMDRSDAVRIDLRDRDHPRGRGMGSKLMSRPSTTEPMGGPSARTIRSRVPARAYLAHGDKRDASHTYKATVEVRFGTTRYNERPLQHGDVPYAGRTRRKRSLNYRPREFPRGVCIRPEPLRFHAEGDGVLGCGREERLRLAKNSSRFGTGTV